jgi:hypothetical protein
MWALELFSSVIANRHDDVAVVVGGGGVIVFDVMAVMFSKRSRSY